MYYVWPDIIFSAWWPYLTCCQCSNTPAPKWKGCNAAAWSPRTDRFANVLRATRKGTHNSWIYRRVKWARMLVSNWKPEKCNPLRIRYRFKPQYNQYNIPPKSVNTYLQYSKLYVYNTYINNQPTKANNSQQQSTANSQTDTAGSKIFECIPDSLFIMLIPP